MPKSKEPSTPESQLKPEQSVPPEPPKKARVQQRFDVLPEEIRSARNLLPAFKKAARSEKEGGR